MSGGGKGVAAGRVEANINLQGGAKGIPDSEAKSVLQNLVQRGPDSEARSVLQNLALPSENQKHLPGFEACSGLPTLWLAEA